MYRYIQYVHIYICVCVYVYVCSGACRSDLSTRLRLHPDFNFTGGIACKYMERLGRDSVSMKYFGGILFQGHEVGIHSQRLPGPQKLPKTHGPKPFKRSPNGYLFTCCFGPGETFGITSDSTVASKLGVAGCGDNGFWPLRLGNEPATKGPANAAI